MDLWFKNDRHRQLFVDLNDKMDHPKGMDSLACIYVLSAIGKDSVRKYIVESDRIAFDELLGVASPWSSSEKALLKLAAHLFNSIWPANIDEVFYNLDYNNKRIALKAIQMRYNVDMED
jgi:hypothetical protein